MIKTREEVLKKYVEKPFTHTEIVEKDNALLAMQQYHDQFETEENKREEYDKLLRAFRSECLPFGEYPDYVIIEFLNDYFKTHESETH